MPVVNTIRTERRVVEERRFIQDVPKFKKGDYVEVYSGRMEGHEFVIADVRYNYDRQDYEFFYNWPLGDEWYVAGQLVKNSYPSRSRR
jgi:hypothetical protein